MILIIQLKQVVLAGFTQSLPHKFLYVFVHLGLCPLLVFLPRGQRLLQVRVDLHLHRVEELGEGEGHVGEAGLVAGVVRVVVVEFVVDSEAVDAELLFKSRQYQVHQDRLRNLQHTTPIRVSALGDEHNGTLYILTVIECLKVLEKTRQLIFLLLSLNNLGKLHTARVRHQLPVSKLTDACSLLAALVLVEDHFGENRLVVVGQKHEIQTIRMVHQNQLHFCRVL